VGSESERRGHCPTGGPLDHLGFAGPVRSLRRAGGVHKTLVVDATLLAEDFADVPSERLVAIRERLLKEINLEQENDELAKDVRAFVARRVGAG
jgi:hypothetical protein